MYTTNEKIVYFRNKVDELTTQFLQLGGTESMLDCSEPPTVQAISNVFIDITDNKTGERGLMAYIGRSGLTEVDLLRLSSGQVGGVKMDINSKCRYPRIRYNPADV